MPRSRLACLALSVVFLVGCGDDSPQESLPAGPESMALRLFALAQSADPTPETLRELFGDEAIGDEGYGRAALLDAIEGLRPHQMPSVIATHELAGLDRLALDLEVELPDDGRALYSVQLDVSGERPTIAWFSGPDVEWPEKTRRGPGVTTSAPPSALQGG